MKVLIGLPRYLTWPLVTTLMTGGVLLTHPDGIVSAIEDVRHSRVWNDQVEKCQERDQQLQGNLEVVLDRTSQKEYLITQWVRGALSFRSLVTQFDNLNQGSDSIRRTIRTTFGEQVREEEVTALNALLYLDAHLRMNSSADHYRARLRSEFVSLYGHPPPELR